MAIAAPQPPAAGSASGRVPRTVIGDSLEIPRMINGLWQLSGGHDGQDVDMDAATAAMDSLITLGLDAFDMADHYGDAELVVGQHKKTREFEAKTFTKWCPVENGITTLENAEQAVDLALKRMQRTKIPIMQYHPWSYSDPTWIHNLCHLRTIAKQKGKIGHIGLTNVDAAHLQLLLDSGIPIATNQVPTNLIDRRVVTGRLNDLCVKRGVGLLAYASLLGGFISEKWLGQPEPADMEQLNWSLRKYLRFIRAAGGWAAFQAVLRAADTVARRHGVPISAVATRYVLDIPAVKAVIVGSRLDPSNASDYAERNLLAFQIEFSDEDRALIAEAQKGLSEIPGDCGDEYRRAPFLTATGDLSLHMDESADEFKEMRAAVEEGRRIEYRTGSEWEPIAGYCRAVRVGSSIHVSGTTSNSPISELPCIGGSSAASQTTWILDTIERALKGLGSQMKDVVRTRIMLQNAEDCEAVSRVHGWRMACEGILPANTLVTNGIIGHDMLVEIEAWAEVGSGKGQPLVIGA